MKKNYITGFLSGLLGATLVFALVVAAVLFIDNGKNNAAKTPELTTQDATKKDKVEEKDTPYVDIVKKLEKIENAVNKFYLEPVDQGAFADGIYKGFVDSLEDPYSTYYTEEELNTLMESSSGVYHGIGALVSQDVKTGIITIYKPFASSPAEKAGILPGDIIYKIEGKEMTGVDLSEAVSLMKGPAGTKVNVTIVREGESDPLEYTITRRKINVPTIESKMLKNNIGYITISEFDEITISQFSKAVTELEKAGMKGLILDVRNNPGGLLYSVVEMLDRLLPKGLIVYTEDKNGVRLEENADDSDEVKVPIAVIINGNSASASEIFAGALQDYEKATIVGTTSFGKGIVQKVFDLKDGTAVKLTISKYYTPKGRNIHGTGIIPDVEVELEEELKKLITIPIEEDNQLQEAIKVIKDKLK